MSPLYHLKSSGHQQHWRGRAAWVHLTHNKIGVKVLQFFCLTGKYLYDFLSNVIDYKSGLGPLQHRAGGRVGKVGREASKFTLETATTLHCHHHGEGNPSTELPLYGVAGVEHRISKPDDRTLRAMGVATIRKSGKDFHARSPLKLNFMKHLSHKVFEIHCDEGCSMIDVLRYLSKMHEGDSVDFLVNTLKPNDNYAMIYRDLVTVRPERFTVQKLPSSIFQSR